MSRDACRSTDEQQTRRAWPGTESGGQQQWLMPACFIIGHGCAALGEAVTESATATMATKARFTRHP